MKKQIIAVDIDDVLSDQNEAIMRFANEQYGLNLTIEDYSIEAPYWGYWEAVWGVDEEEGARRLQAFHDVDGTMFQEVVPHAIEVIRELEQSFELVIVTARRDEFAEVTHAWLNRHFPEIFKQVRFAQVWSDNRRETKAEICQHIGASYLIDDNIEHCELAAEAGITALLFGEYGWNKQDTLPDKVVRVRDWLAVREYFRDVLAR